VEFKLVHGTLPPSSTQRSRHQSNSQRAQETNNLDVPSDKKDRFERLCIERKMRGCRPSSGFFRTLLGWAALLLCAASAEAAATPVPHGTVELIAENQWISAGHKFDLGLRFQLEKGWHIYWVNPGDSGEPPRVRWQLPAGLTAGAIEWPTPRRLGTSTIVDYGYEDAVVLLAPMSADASLAAQGPVQLGAEVRVLVCREVCVPGDAQVSLTLPLKSQPLVADGRTSELFIATRKQLPQTPPEKWKFSVVAAKDSYVLTANLGQQTTQAMFFPLAESQIDNAAPQKLVPVTTGFQLTLRKSDQLLGPIERLKGVLVLCGDRAYIIDAPLGKSEATRNRDGAGIRAAQTLKEGL
jgi:DsbC/DsbD-like thiol-disulfide interchange protein